MEMMKDKIKTRLDGYDNEVNGRLRNDGFECRHEYENAFYIDNEEGDMEPEEPTNLPDIDKYTPEAFDEYIGAQMMVNQGNERIQGRICKQARTDEGNPISRRNNNPFLDTRKYEVELLDGTIEEYYANIIAENLFSQVDSEGRQYILLKEISDHRRDETALPLSEGFMTTNRAEKSASEQRGAGSS
jgi:hypothetical protein